MADMILLGLAVICTAFFMPEWGPLLPLSGFSLQLYVYFLYMENGITGKIWTASPGGCR